MASTGSEEPIAAVESIVQDPESTQAHESEDEEIKRFELREVIEDNPHCHQLHAPACKPYLSEALIFGRTMTDDMRYLSKSLPKMKYIKRKAHHRSSCHWGQLKLLESEIKFLTDFTNACAGENYTFVYAGAAPGKHIIFLADLFPSVNFELYDPAPFDPQLIEKVEGELKDRVKLITGFFDESVAQEIASRNIDKLLFVSDIRTSDTSHQKSEEVEEYVESDMKRQHEWCKAMKPFYSMLKLRLPWEAGYTRYLPGKMLIQAFPPTTSTESRLMVSREECSKLATYSNTEYEQQFMYHNTIQRAFPFMHGCQADGLDACYDCSALVHTLQRYLSKSGKDADDLSVSQLVVATIASIRLPRHQGLKTQYVDRRAKQQRQTQKREYKQDESGKDVLVISTHGQNNKKRKAGKGGGPQVDRQDSKKIKSDA